MTPRILAMLISLLLVASACSDSSADADQAQSTTQPSTTEARTFAPAPEVTEGPLSDETKAAIDMVVAGFELRVEPVGMQEIGATGDVRLAWLVSDFMKFSNDQLLRDAAEELTDLAQPNFVTLTDHLIAWDIPSPPGYVEWKRAIFASVDDRWNFVFNDPDSAMDFRYLTWGGVLIDDRPLGDTRGCIVGCIPALDNPAVTAAGDGDWYPDDALVFGVEINGEARAYPKNQMEVHEMVNDTLGGRRIGMPYCTLCLSAQVYFLDDLPSGTEQPVLRTSGLLSRSNKVMYDLVTQSVFDTFTGRAISGPLLDAEVQLNQASVITTTWGDWKAAHPDTTILAEDGGIGRSYVLNPLRGRDDNGPIFPVGEVDSRLTVHDRVLTVLTPDGTAIAFPVGAAALALEQGDAVELSGVSVQANAGGLSATFDGQPIATHEAFWFAWSQFEPDTLLWAG